MTTILAIDTATGPCSVAIWKDGRIAGYSENAKPVMQSASLMPMIEEVLSKSNTGYGDLSAVACTVGPGSFTGIRVGLAAARGICFAAGIEGRGFTTLDVLAFAARGTNVLAILNAGKGEYYYQTYIPSPHRGEAGRGAQHVRQSTTAPTLTLPLRGREFTEPRLGPLEDAIAASPGAVTVAGNIAVADPRFTASPVTFPRADALAELAATGAASLPLKPFYIRAPDAKLPVKKA